MRKNIQATSLPVIPTGALCVQGDTKCYVQAVSATPLCLYDVRPINSTRLETIAMLLLRKSVLTSVFMFGVLFLQQTNAQTISSQATTNVVVNFPEVLVLYTFSDVSLNMDAAFLKSNMGLGTLTVCSTGNCVNAGGIGPVTVDATSEDLDLASDAQVPGISALTDITLTLQNAVGARSLGMTDANYTLGVADGGLTGVLGVGATQPTSFTNTGLALSTQSLQIKIDVSEIDTQAESVSVNENFVITVSGT